MGSILQVVRIRLRDRHMPWLIQRSNKFYRIQPFVKHYLIFKKTLHMVNRLCQTQPSAQRLKNLSLLVYCKLNEDVVCWNGMEWNRRSFNKVDFMQDIS